MGIEKTFRVATAGRTIDGRKISEEQIIKMAQNYNPRTYQALINFEHFKYFGSFGEVVEIKTIRDDRGLGLYAKIKPYDNLIELNKSNQKLFTSVEIMPNFPSQGEYYLSGLAITDNPASQGLDMMKFTANRLENEKFSLVFEEMLDESGTEGQEQEFNAELSEKVANSLWKKIADKFNFNKEGKEMNEKNEKREKELEEKVINLTAELEKTKESYNALVEKNQKLEQEKANFDTKLGEVKENFNKELEEVKAEVEKLKATPMSSQRSEATGETGEEKVY